MDKALDFPMKYFIFKPSDPITILAFLHNFKNACDSNGGFGVAAMWFFPYFLKKPAKAGSLYRMSAKENINTHKEGTLSACFQSVSYLLEAHATHDVIAEAKANIMNWQQPETMSTTRYSDTLWEKALNCWQVYDESRVKDVFTEGLHHSTCFSIRNQWDSTKEVPYETWHATLSLISNFRKIIKLAASLAML